MWRSGVSGRCISDKPESRRDSGVEGVSFAWRPRSPRRSRAVCDSCCRHGRSRARSHRMQLWRRPGPERRLCRVGRGGRTDSGRARRPSRTVGVSAARTEHGGVREPRAPDHRQLLARTAPSGSHRGVAVVAQSAGINLTVGFLLAKLGYGVSYRRRARQCDRCRCCRRARVPCRAAGTKAIALHLEGVKEGRRLYETIRRVTPKKPVAVLTVGRQDVGEFAHSHTGNLIGSLALRASALRQAGAVVVESTEELAAAAAVLSLYRLPPKARCGDRNLDSTGGARPLDARSAQDAQCVGAIVESRTLARISELLPAMTYTKNPVDTGRPDASFGECCWRSARTRRSMRSSPTLSTSQLSFAPTTCCPRGTAARKPIMFGTDGTARRHCAGDRSLRAQRIYVAESPEQLARAGGVVLSRTRRCRLASRATEAGDSRLAQVEVPQRATSTPPSRCWRPSGSRRRGALFVRHTKQRTKRSGGWTSRSSPKFWRRKSPTRPKWVASNWTSPTSRALSRALARLDAIPLHRPAATSSKRWPRRGSKSSSARYAMRALVPP